MPATTGDTVTKDRGITQPKLGPSGWLRWAWRQLTSMRTALLLLLALAIAALPGSFLPQRSIDATRTTDWIATHPSAGPILDRLGFFEVYASPWFAAIYLLLLVSLIGCVIPRARQHWRAMRSPLPRTPKRIERLPVHESLELDADPDRVAHAVAAALRLRRFRVHAADGAVSAERGYLKETGNLAFHLALVVIIVGVAIGQLWGWKGDVILPEGQTFVNTLGRYDTFAPGPLVDANDLPPFAIRLERFDATFEQDPANPGQFGTPRDFTAHVGYTTNPESFWFARTIAVNHPLEADGATVFLLGNGYAPVVTVRDAKGEILYTGATPFLAQDNNYKSVGAIKVPAAGTDKQLGFTGFFLPTAVIDPETGPASIFPQPAKPALALSLFEGELAPGGRATSVYTLDTSAMTQVKDPAKPDEPLRIWLEPGQTLKLPGDRGTITFDSVSRFAGLSIRHDPGQGLVLVAAIVALAGLIASLVVRRRRVFARVTAEDGSGSTLLVIGGLGKEADDGLPEILAAVVADVTSSLSSGKKDS